MGGTVGGCVKYLPPFQPKKEYRHGHYGQSHQDPEAEQVPDFLLTAEVALAFTSTLAVMRCVAEQIVP